MTESPNYPMNNPYVGPLTFTYAQRNLFFGREREARDLLARVVSERLLLFYAQSGAGKSSLLHTRLIPQLRSEEGFAVLPVGRISGEVPAGVGGVENIYLFNLMASLDQSNVQPARLAGLSLSHFLANLTSEDGEHWRYVDHLHDATQIEPARATATPTPEPRYAEQRYVLLIDQFEEIITTHPNRWRERENFFRQLNQALLDDPNLWVVLTLREDYVAALDPYTQLMTDKLRARFYMERMDDNAALKAIRRPAVIAGRPFAEGVAEILVDNLRRVKVAGQDKEQLGQYVEPVQLQVVCYQLWENLFGTQEPTISTEQRSISLVDLQRSGDVDTALADFYEDAVQAALQVENVDMAERALRMWFNAEMITEAGTRGTVYRGEESTSGMPNAVVDALQNRFLLRTELRAGSAWVELVHDRFVKPVLDANLAWQTTYNNPVAAAYVRWQATKSPEQLLRSQDLIAAEAYARQYPKEITEEEKQYLTDSRRQWDSQEKETQRAVERRRNLLIAGALIMLFLSGLTIYAFRQANEARHQAQIANSRQLATQSDNALAQGNGGQALLLAIAAGQVSDTSEAFSAIRSSIVNSGAAIEQRLPHGGPIIEIAWNGKQRIASTGQAKQIKLWDIAQGKAIATWPVPEDAGIATRVAWNFDGTLLATGHVSGMLLIWSQDGKPTAKLEHQGSINSVDWHPQKNLILTSDSDQMLRVWNPVSKEPIQKIPFTANLKRARWNATGTAVLIAGGDGSITAWNIEQGISLFELKPYTSTSGVTDVRWSNSGNQMLTAGEIGFSKQGRLFAAHLWNVDEERQIPFLTFGGHDSVVRQAALSPRETLVATAGDDQEIRIWDTQTGLLVKVLRGHEGVIYSLVWRDETHLLSAGTDGFIFLWNIEPSSELPLRNEYQDRIRILQWLDDETLLSAADDGLGHVWRAADGAILMTLNHGGVINRTQRNKDGSRLLTASGDGTVGVWDLKAHQEITHLGKGIGRYLYARWNQPSESLIMAGYECIHNETPKCPTDLYQIHIWRAEKVLLGVSPEPDLILTGHQGHIATARWNLTDHVAKRESRMATASYDGTIRIWDVAFDSPRAGQVVQILTHSDVISATTVLSSSPAAPPNPTDMTRWLMEAKWNRDGSALLSYGRNGSARVWRWQRQSAEFVASPPLNHNGPVNWADWFQNDQRIVTVSDDGVGRIWHAQNGRLIHELKGHQSAIQSAYWNTSAKSRLLTFSDDGPAMLWDMVQGTLLHTFAGHRQKVSGALLDETQDLLLTYSEDKTARLWRLSTGDPLVIFAGQRDDVVMADWNPSRTRIITGSQDGVVHQVYRTMSDLLHKVCSMPAITALSEEQRRQVLGTAIEPPPCTGIP